MLAYIIATIARQENGETVLVKINKVFLDRQKAESYANTLSTTLIEELEVPNIGKIKCACERSVFIVDIEE